jgi:DNA-binding CsgD family transcriptional regulator
MHTDIDDFRIERHIVFVPTLLPMSRTDSQENEGRKKAAISLPRVSCLDTLMEGERKKYYRPEELSAPVETQVELLDSGMSAALKKRLSAPLTPREFTILNMVAEGMSILEIANKLDLSVKYVRSFLSTAQRKTVFQANKDAKE